MKAPVHATAEDLVKNGPCVAWFNARGVTYFIHGGYLSHPGMYPQLGSDEWIDFVPEPALIHKDGDLWWRYYDAELDTMVSVQLTKGTEDEDLPRIVPPRRVR